MPGSLPFPSFCTKLPRCVRMLLSVQRYVQLGSCPCRKGAASTRQGHRPNTLIALKKRVCVLGGVKRLQSQSPPRRESQNTVLCAVTRNSSASHIKASPLPTWSCYIVGVNKQGSHFTCPFLSNENLRLLFDGSEIPMVPFIIQLEINKLASLVKEHPHSYFPYFLPDYQQINSLA